MLRGFALFLGMFLVPIWGGPSGVYMFACVRYFWVHTTKKSLVIFCSNSGGGDSSRVLLGYVIRVHELTGPN